MANHLVYRFFGKQTWKFKFEPENKDLWTSYVQFNGRYLPQHQVHGYENLKFLIEQAKKYSREGRIVKLSTKKNY